MKKYFLFLAISFVLGYGCSDSLEPVSTFTSTEVANEPVEAYYYANGEKHYLELNTNYVFVSVEEESDIAPLKLLRNCRVNDSRIIETHSVLTRSANVERKWVEVEFHENMNYDQYKESLENLRGINEDMIVSPYFRNSLNDRIGLSNYFYVKLKQQGDSIILKDIAIKTNTNIIGANAYQPLWYVLEVSSRTDKNSLEMANYYHESGLFEYAEPDLMEDNLLAKTMNDPYLSRQWGIRPDLTRAWDLSTGRGIKIAIVDSGVLKTHEDLPYPSSSYDSGSESSPSRMYDNNHGTSCAGVALAIGNNGKGISGVAPDAQLIDISNPVQGGTFQSMHLADGIMKATNLGADVISNSWGGTVKSTIVYEAIYHAISRGRGGKGCVVVFCSHNDSRASVRYPSESPNVLCVGAIDQSNRRAYFSNYGNGLDVVAPGVSIYTTNMNGGYSYVDGTSFSCPYAAGVAALILSKNPSLNQLKVREIIQNTSTQLSSYSFSMVSDGYKNHEIGHGLVNPEAAVRLASYATSGHGNVRVYGFEFGDIPNVCNYIQFGNREVDSFDSQIFPSAPFTVNSGTKSTSFYVDNVRVELSTGFGLIGLSSYSWRLNAQINNNRGDIMDAIVKFERSSSAYTMWIDLKNGVLNDGDDLYISLEEPLEMAEFYLVR